MPASKRHLRRRLRLRRRLTWLEKPNNHRYVYARPKAWLLAGLFSSPRVARRKP